MLSEVLRIKGTSPWVLRVQDDGVARQVLGNHVRAGLNYLIVSDVPLAPTSVRDLRLLVAASEIDDAVIYSLSIPRVLGPDELRALAAMKIGYALRANIEPVGLVPRWDGEGGYAEWLTTEEPLLRLSADHPVQEFTVSIDRHAVLRIPVGSPPEAIISLGQLAVGLHVIEVGGLASELHTGRLEPESLGLAIRTPIPWAKGVRDSAGFRTIKEPPDASLEHVLAGKARIAVIGPPERPVTIDAQLFNLNGHLAERIALGTVASLADEAALRQLVIKLAKEPLAEKVQAAPRVDLTFLVDELGMDSLSFPHKVQPFRWRLTLEGHEYCARLIDEAGADHPIVISRYTIAHPDQKLDAEPAQYLGGQVIESPGALLTAVCNDERFSAVISVPPHQKLTALNDLGVNITVSTSINAPRHIPRLLSLLRLWSRARQALGPLSMLRKAEVCEALVQRIAAILCGTGWADRARQCQSAQQPSLEQLRRDIGGSPGFAARLQTNDWRSAADDPTARAEFIRLASVYQISDDPELCGLALRIAFAPEAIKFRTPDNGRNAWERLAQVPTLARGAFFARLVTDLTGHDLPAAEVA